MEIGDPIGYIGPPDKYTNHVHGDKYQPRKDVVYHVRVLFQCNCESPDCQKYMIGIEELRPMYNGEELFYAQKYFAKLMGFDDMKSWIEKAESNLQQPTKEPV